MNDFFKWDKSFNTGLEKIDEQHQSLAVLINDLYVAVVDNYDESSKKTTETVKKLTEYALIHFTYEESLFTKHNFPEAQDHIEKHEKFKIQIAEFHESIESGFTVTFQVVQFLKKWLLDHIKDCDMQYVKYIPKE